MTETSINTNYADALAQHRNEDPVVVPHVIAGEQFFTGALIERENPSDGRTIVSACHDAPDELIDRAVEASRTAQKEWRKISLRERVKHVRRGIAFLEKRIADFGLRVSLEAGKREAQAKAEAVEVIEFLRIYCDYMDSPEAFTDVREPSDPTITSRAVLRPYGVFGVITPFNYPLAQSGGPAIAAVLAGNGIVLKTSHEGPWSGHALYEVFESMGLPKGLVNVVHGADAPGRALANSSIDGIAFTGSVRVGKSILQQFAQGDYSRPVIAEMGGKNPVIVSNGADIDKAAEGIVFSAFDMAGQKCTGLSRVLATPDVYDDLVARVFEKSQAIRVGGPEDDDTFYGPVVNPQSLERFDSLVQRSKREGFRVSGGKRIDREGYFLTPTVVADVPHDHDLAVDEHFLPLLTISKVDNFETALEVANMLPVGLSAGIYTGEPEQGRIFLDEIEAGLVNVNVGGHATTLWWPGPQTMGGWKASGSTGKQAYGKWYVEQFAREQGRKYPTDLVDFLEATPSD